MKIPIVDHLTEVYNRRYLFVRLDEEIKRARRTGHPFSILFIDIDQFKGINEAFGHLKGDEILRNFARVLRECVRECDLIFRYAGDEFIVLLPETDKRGAVKIAKRVTEGISSTPLSRDPEIKLTVSIGISSFPQDGRDTRTLINVADRALAEAKMSGGNTSRVPSRFRLTKEDLLKWVHAERLVGRVNELHRLTVLYEDAMAGEGRAALISGETGIGKTRLAQELMKRAALKGSHILSGRSFESTMGIPYFPLREIVREAEAFVENLNPFLKKEIRKLLPLEDQSKGNHQPENIYRFYYALKSFFSIIAQSGGLVLLFDDVHWADDATIRFLEYLGKNLRGTGIFLLMVYRTEEVLPVSFVSVKGNLLREKVAEEIHLGPLSPEHVRAMLRMMFHRDFPEDFVKMVTMETEGNPFYIEELMRELIMRGLLYHNGEKIVLKKIDSFPLPTSVEALIERRLHRVDDEVKEVLEYASAIGKNFSYMLLKDTLDADEGFLWEALDAAIDHRIIEEIGDGEFTFTHIKLRDVIYEHLSSLKRRRIHKEILKALEKQNADVELLAHHSYMGEAWAKALLYSQKAAQKEKKAYAYREAFNCLEQAIEASEHIDSDPSNLIYEKASILLSLGKYREGLNVIEEGIQYAKKYGNRKALGQFYTLKADTLLTIGELRGVEELLNRAFKILEKLDEKELIAEVWHGLANLKSMRGEKDAIDIFRKVEKLYDDPEKIMGLYDDIATFYYRLGRYEEALKYEMESLEMVKKIKDRESEAAIINNLGVIYESLGNKKKAEECYKEALKIATEMGLRSYMLTPLGNLATLYTGLGKLEEALDAFEESVALAKEMGIKMKELIILNNLAYLYQYRGDLKKALSIFNEALKVGEKLGDPPFTTLVIGNIGRLYHVKGETDEAIKWLKRAIKKGPTDIWVELHIKKNLAEALAFKEKFKEAKKYCDEAIRIAESIDNLDAKRKALVSLAVVKLLKNRGHGARKVLKEARKIAEKLEEQDALVYIDVLLFFLDVIRGKKRKLPYDVRRKIINRSLLFNLEKLKEKLEEKYNIQIPVELT